MNRLTRLIVLGFWVALVAACGGGSDPFYKEPSPNPTPTNPTTPPFGTFEPIQRAAITSWPAPVRTEPAGPRVLVLYDEPTETPWAKLGSAFGILLRNLVGHFDAKVDAMPVQQYRKSAVNDYHTTFYIGWSAAHDLPMDFLQDVRATTQRVVWMFGNLEQLAELDELGEASEGLNFQAQYGFTLGGTRGFDPGPTPEGTIPSFFSTVHYKNLPWHKTATINNGVIDAAPEMFLTQVTDATKVRVHAAISNPTTRESAPYVLQSGNFWFVADIPFNYYTPRDRYVVVADLLHDMLGIDHEENHRAMVRLEDVDAKVNPEAFKKLVDYLHSKSVPFAMAVIAHYKDPFGSQSNGVPADIPMAEATNLRLALDYALARGGEILQHGTTHQYENMINDFSGASGIDFEFWDMVDDKPAGRLDPVGAEPH